MISRRNIRVKVMQTCYTLMATQPDSTELAVSSGMKMLNEKLSHSLDLFTTVINYIMSVALYAETDARVRSSKYLPTEADKNVSTKIAGNDFIWQTLNNDTYKEKVKLPHIASAIDDDWVKRLYQKLIVSTPYQEYIATLARDPKTEKSIIRYIWTELMLKNEDFQGYLQDEMSGWEDDIDMIYMLIDNFFKNSTQINFLFLLSGEKLDYAKSLLQTIIEKQDYCMELIKPKLINWEAERVAQIDLILLRMGICEFLYFPTIPTKVTINEYIEVAKLYSTPQSGHFVNAILDKILKDLENDHQIHKKDRIVK